MTDRKAEREWFERVGCGLSLFDEDVAIHNHSSKPLKIWIVHESSGPNITIYDWTDEDDKEKARKTREKKAADRLVDFLERNGMK